MVTLICYLADSFASDGTRCFSSVNRTVGFLVSIYFHKNIRRIPVKARSVLISLGLVVLVGEALTAQQQRDRLQQWDKNKDGQLSKDELPESARNRFLQMDADRDGVVSRGEMDAFVQRRNNAPAAADKPPMTATTLRKHVPAHGDVKYGTHRRNVMDVWLAQSQQPTPVLVSIHGGGFTSGDKSVEPALLDACLQSGFSVVAITYRMSQDAIAPAPFLDGARAIQFIRHNAKQWNIDPTRIAATGGSAGAGISLWLGFHDDLADPNNSDPVLRQSTRLTCMAVSNGQTSYDPRFIRELFPEDDQVYRLGALRSLFDADLDRLDQLPTEKYSLFDEVSPLHHLTKDDVPALLTYLVKDSNEIAGIHSPRFGHALKTEMDKLGIRSEVVTHVDRDDPRYALSVLEFIMQEFGIEPTSIKRETKVGGVATPVRKGRVKPNGEYYAPPAMAERVDSQLGVGDAAPGFSLQPLGGGDTISLSQFQGNKPVVLVFGSITCSPFRQAVLQTFDLHQRYGDKAEFLMIYIREAHPESSIRFDENGNSELKVFTQTDTLQARIGNAQSCSTLLQVPFPLLIDGEDNATLAAYGAWPNRLVVVGKDGRVAWDSGEGPRGFRPDLLGQWLNDNL